MGIHDSHAATGTLDYKLTPESYRQTFNRHPRLWEQSGPRSELLVPAPRLVVPNSDTCGPNAVAWVQKSLAYQAQPMPNQCDFRLPWQRMHQEHGTSTGIEATNRQSLSGLLSDAGQASCAGKQIVDVSTLTGTTPGLHLVLRFPRHSSTLKKGT